MTNKQIETLAKEEVKNILDELYQRRLNVERTDCGINVYEITPDGELGEKISNE